jgi:hypothetical protein
MIWPLPRTNVTGVYLCPNHEKQLRDAVESMYRAWFRKGKTPQGETPGDRDVWNLRGRGRKV